MEEKLQLMEHEQGSKKVWLSVRSGAKLSALVRKRVALGLSGPLSAKRKKAFRLPLRVRFCVLKRRKAAAERSWWRVGENELGGEREMERERGG